MFSFIVFGFSNIVLADCVANASNNNCNYGLGNAKLDAGSLFGQADVPTVIANVIQIIMGLSATVMLVVILWAGFSYLISRGDSTKTKKSLDLIISASIGIIIIVTAYSLSQFIINNIKFIAK